MSYSKVSIPVALYQKFRSTAASLGWAKRGQCWKLLDILLEYAKTHSDLFSKR